MDKPQKPGGVLFYEDESRRRSENSPNFSGRISISADELRSLQQQIESGEPVATLSVAGWRKTSGGGKDYISLSARAWVERGEQQPRQSRPQQPSKPRDEAPPRVPDFDDEIPF